MKVTNEQAQELLDLFRVGDTTESWSEFGDEWKGIKIKLVQDELVDTSRWSHIHERIYQNIEDGKFYSTSYSTGATECQNERPYEYDGDMIDFIEVKAIEKTITVFEAV